MFRVITNITISQQPSKAFPNRKTVVNMDFCHSYESSDSWRDLTNQGKLTIPKNLYFRDQFGKLRPLFGTNVNVGGFSSNAPLVLRGDKVTIVAGYKYFASKNASRETTNINTIFTGWISGVDAKIPIEAKMEDNMWLLKQTPVDTRTFGPKENLNTILQFLVNKCNSIYNTKFTVNALTETTFGSFAVGNESACQVLQRMQKVYGFESYFRGDELRCGSIIYIPSEAVTKTFTFQQDIIEDNLEYVRKDDLVLSALARNTIVEETGEVTKTGIAKTKKVRLEVLVTLFNGITTIKQINKGDKVAENNEGERRTFFFPGATTVQQLGQLALNEITKYYYTGLRGDFTAFGLPFMRQGDNANIVNPILPEMNGLFKIKKVEYTGGVIGLRQKIFLDFKINV